MPVFDAHAYWTESPITRKMADPSSILAAQRQHDIAATALISGLAAQCDFVTGNRRLADILNPAAGLYGYVVLNADYPEESFEEQRKYLGRPEVVGGAMFGQAGRPVTVDDAREVLNAHRRYSKPMAIHVPNGEAVHAAREIAVEFPAMKFIFLGMGGDQWRTAVQAAKKHLNIYLEISGSLDADKVAHAAEALTPRKVLYGSGMPKMDPSLTLGLVQTARTVTGGDRARILSQNALALFNVQPEPPRIEITSE